MGCCNKFEQNEYSATRSGNPIFKGFDKCGDKATYRALAGAEYAVGIPVKLSDTVGVVEPALDGVDAIGISLSTFSSATANDEIFVHRTGHIWWQDIAEGLGKDPNSESDWWEMHKALIKTNIYVEFK